MKKFLYVLLTVLMALPAMADDAEQTASPVITIEENQGALTIIVEGNGMLYVQVMRDNDYDWDISTIVDEAQVEGHYEYTIQRSNDDGFNGEVIATAQEEGMYLSETVHKQFLMRPYFVMPQPEITFTEDPNGVTIDVTGGVALLQVSITVNGEPIVYQEVSSSSFTFYIEKAYEELYIEVLAINQGTTHGDIWQEATSYYVLAPKELPIAAKPEITVTEGDEYYTISASSDEPGSIVHLFVDGLEVENPWIIERSDYDQEYYVVAYADVPGMEQSQSVSITIVVSALVQPEVTAMPEITSEEVILDDGNNAVIIRIIPNEECSDIYFRYAVEGGEYSEWMSYDDAMIFTGPGYYVIEAYAVAGDKLPSEIIAMMFCITEPEHTKLYDFEEDGIFYKYISEGKVSVCSETAEYNTYSGNVSIPATVTHDGVTYMVNAIADHAFRDCTGLTGVSIGAYVTTIGDHAFSGCSSLTSVTLGDYVTHLGKYAFAYCTALAEVKMGSGMRNIGERAFQNCNSLTSVTCKAATTPYLFHRGCFDCYSKATLHVYPAVLDSYKSTNTFWSQFATIVGEDQVAPATGDINGDGKMSITDVTSLINMLLGGQ